MAATARRMVTPSIGHASNWCSTQRLIEVAPGSLYCAGQTLEEATMREANSHYTRRYFLATAAAAAGAAAFPLTPSRAAAKYTRYNVTSPEGQKALASYAKGVEAMLKLPADDPRNWFRNAFVHFMDCPHGNWWFYVWHRGYIGYLEQTIRALSGDLDFALPYWDWTAP